MGDGIDDAGGAREGRPAKAEDAAKLDALAARRRPMRDRLLHLLGAAVDFAERPDVGLGSTPLPDFRAAWADVPPSFADGKTEAAVLFVERLATRARHADRPATSEPAPGATMYSKAEVDDPTAGDFAPLPAGTYTARVTHGELTTAKTGTPGYTLTFKVADGEQRVRVH